MLFLYSEGKQVGIPVDCGKIAMQTNFCLLGTPFSFPLPLSDQFVFTDLLEVWWKEGRSWVC